jgi:hypothetical protein
MVDRGFGRALARGKAARAGAIGLRNRSAIFLVINSYITV